MSPGEDENILARFILVDDNIPEEDNLKSKEQKAKLQFKIQKAFRWTAQSRFEF